MISDNKIKRFNSKIKKLESGCWVYTGYIDSKGYGRFRCKNLKTTLAHRISWIINHGSIPKGLLVCHTCDNPPCIRIDHLWLGTHKDNTHDMYHKNRRKRKVFDDSRLRARENSLIELKKICNTSVSIAQLIEMKLKLEESNNENDTYLLRIINEQLIRGEPIL